MARVCFYSETAVADDLERIHSSDPIRFNELICCRRELTPDAEAERARGYLAMGYFSAIPEQMRLAAFLLCFDVERELRRFDTATRFQRYALSQPLFQLIPKLRDHIRDSELIDYHAVRHLPNDGEIVEHMRRYAIIDRWLNATIVSGAAAEFSGAPIFVRLHPFRAYLKKPRSLLMEATYRPANPKWWKTLSLHVGCRDGGEYVLEDYPEPTQQNKTEWWDYRIRKIRALQVSGKRDDHSHLTMMAEELSEELLDEGLLIGRCLHFDTDSPVGTDFGRSTLLHLDLAINVYSGERIADRRAQKLAEGKVADASYRCHLFRIERIPFAAMFSFPLAFFRSRVLPGEWLDDQFTGWRDVFDA